jgi:hypothetical protein
LRQADQARTDFAAIESDLQFVMAQLARIPTRKEQARNMLGIIFATAMLIRGHRRLPAAEHPTARPVPPQRPTACK